MIHYCYLICRPYSGFASCLGGILRSKENPRSHIAYGCHVFLVSFKLEPSFSLSLTFLTLTFGERIGQVFCRMSLDSSHTTPDVLIPPQLFSGYTSLLSTFPSPASSCHWAHKSLKCHMSRLDEGGGTRSMIGAHGGTHKLTVLPTDQILMECKSQRMWGRWGRRPGSP